MKRAISSTAILLIILASATIATGQTVEFTYQGRLLDNSLPPTANYDFEFRLFSVETGGVAINTLSRSGVAVSNGVFTVKLDFGGQFDGNSRWLEIAVRPTGSPNPFTVLTPRQPITSTPYSVRSLTSTNSLQLGGTNANQFVLTTDGRLSDARSPLPNSASYIQNTASQQASSNFNISGNGVVGGTVQANKVNAETQYNLDGLRILSNAGVANLFAGVLAGSSSTTGSANSFFGSAAGRLNTTGLANSFFGNLAGGSNTTGNENSFFGSNAGNNNTGDFNSYFGSRAGFGNTTGQRNSFFGVSSGESNTSANDNAFFGYRTGVFNSANNNSFFGSDAGNQNQTGFNNAFFGRNAGQSNTTGNGNSFFGNSAGVNSTGSANAFFGNSAGSSNSSGAGNSFFGNAAGNTNTIGANNTVIGANADVLISSLSFATAIGAGSTVSNSNTIALGRNTGTDTVRVFGDLIASAIQVVNLGSAGSTNLCRNASVQISTCSSSLRYKTAIHPFIRGLEIIRRLRPISFDWKQSGIRDVGFGAEDVEKVEPLLVTYNDKSEIEGVKYGQVTTVLVNAVNQQQSEIEEQDERMQKLTARIEQQQQQIQEQQRVIDELRKLMCRQDRTAAICKDKQ